MTKYPLRLLLIGAVALAGLLSAACGEDEVVLAPMFRPVATGDLPDLGATFGGTILDLNADGFLDLLMADPARQTALFLNGGNLEFTKTTTGQYPRLVRSENHGAAACDFDNDGDWDVFIAADTDSGRQYGRNHLWVQERPGVFTDLGAADPVISDPIGRGQGGLWTDFDGDNQLELLVFNYQSPALLAAPAAAGWRDVTSRLPWPPPVPMDRDGTPPDRRIRARSGWVHTGIAADFDGDGRQDLLNVGRPGWSGLLLNVGAGEFAERTSVSGLKHAVWPKTPRDAAIGDLNGDGLPDLAFCYRTADEFTRDYTPLEIWLNHSQPGRPSFTMERFVEEDGGKASLLQAVHKPEACLLADLDNDGCLDLYVVQPPREEGAAPNLLYQGHGNGTFSNLTESWGGAGPPDSAPESAWAVDLDNDGDLDLLTFNGGDPWLETSIHRGVALYENMGAIRPVPDPESEAEPITSAPSDNYGVTVHLASPPGPAHGLGAEATLISGDHRQSRRQECTVRGANAAILPLHFGVGTASGPFPLEIRWASGTLQTVSIPAAGRAYLVREGDQVVQTLPRSGDGGSP